MQARFGLEQNPDLMLMVFVGRWSHQKGIDLIADVAEWLLTTHKCQMVVVGPIVDNHGTYALNKLKPLQARFSSHLFVQGRFFRVPMELHAATDICLMPSRDEPFGCAHWVHLSRATVSPPSATVFRKKIKSTHLASTGDA